ncbi:MAG: response regulator [bacterium]|nr:response regulator [bacterium]
MIEKHKILIVDDKLENLTMYCNMLKSIDADLITADNGNDAVKISIDQNIDLLLVDIQMPNMCGYEACKHIKQEEKNKFLPIIFITGEKVDNSLIEKCYKVGAVDFLKRPIRQKLLIEKVRYLLKVRKNRIKLMKSITALSLSEEKYHTLIEATNTGYLIVNSKGEVVDANKEYVRLSGNNKLSEILGRNVLEWTADYDHERNKNEIKKCLKNGFVFGLEIDYIGAQNDVIPIEINAKVIYSKDTFQILTLCRDISKRRNAENSLKKTITEVEKAHKHAIYMLAIASEYKDKTTADHISKIISLTTELALELGIEPDKAEKMGFDSQLHDLGKLGIPDSILLKPGKLTESEFEIIKKHTIIGSKIIGDDDWFYESKQIALLHHEKWDGTGYPKGLAGDAIPLAARIVAVVDVFNALISKRPYKDAWPMKKAVNQIEKESGTHFDPDIVNAFLSLNKIKKLL